ncbi:HAD family hydrolase [Isoalcanivorax pacificus W11-5]|jgi:HAD superfamily hydrolase (TIGR01458 family)|uniref:Haloacid dehalogenase-like hydrolase domain-containing protein 2 n=1 Tax=Isoalcanivorax pacificus W11-5 TaxID=391936 RepID=A0A0B4XNH1_9GAMM|nr:TIGR01458 family HAD-type hydrolase [Isoalcanivorax pacificus]AJD48008.1 HAD family hydrolase [Isoalcanivorax pacificus W11-5]
MGLKAVFLDLAGVLYEGRRAIPGAQDAVARLQASPLTLRFVTNTSRRSRAQVLDDLAQLGFDIAPDTLFTAPLAARQWLVRRGHRPLLLVHPDIECEFAGLSQADPDAVLLADAEDRLNYRNLDNAFRLLMTGAPLLAIGINRYFKTEDGLHLDAGPFVRALEFATGTQAVVAGKPATDFFREVLNDAGCAPEEALMVGDDVHGDVEGALDAGLRAMLVQTGKYRPGDEDRIQGVFGVRPSITEVVDAVLQPPG